MECEKAILNKLTGLRRVPNELDLSVVSDKSHIKYFNEPECLNLI